MSATPRFQAAFLVSLALACAPWASAALAQSTDGQALSVEWTLAKTPKPLEREALITVTDGQGRPVEGAAIEVNVDMPSMPMMHKVPMAVAKPTHEAGRYKAQFTLEMAGEWAAQIEVKNPIRTKVVRKFKVD